MSPDLPRDIRRLLAVRLDNVGDIVLLGPALRALKAARDTHVTLLCSRAGARAAELLPWVDEILEARASWQDVSGSLAQDTTGDRELIARLRRGHFDAALVFTSFTQSSHPPAYACYLAEIPVRAAHSSLFAGAVLTHPAAPPAIEMHQAERNLHLLSALGIPAEDTRLAVRIPPPAAAEAATALRALGIRDGFALVAPGAGCDARRYPPAAFARAVSLLAEEGRQVVVAGSERERELVAEVARAGGPRAVALAGETSVAALASVIERASVAIANDSAALHLADAVGTPVVSPFSGTDLVSQWTPRSVPSAILTRETECSPCYAYECPRGKECLAIPPAEVAEAAMRLATMGDAQKTEPPSAAEGRS